MLFILGTVCVQKDLLCNSHQLVIKGHNQAEEAATHTHTQSYSQFEKKTLEQDRSVLPAERLLHLVITRSCLGPAAVKGFIVVT